jgi:hypothetical protein
MGTMTMLTSGHEAGSGVAPPAEWRGRAATPVNADTAFNGFVCAHVLFALERLEVFEQMEDAGSLDIPEFCAQRSIDERVFRALITAAAWFGHVTVQDDRVSTTWEGQEVSRMVGFFTWAVGGYHDVFAHAVPIARGELRFGEDVRRDEAMVALGSAQADVSLMQHLLDKELAETNFSVLADLGSGTGERLCRLVAARPGARGIGLDISESATGLAVETAHRYGLRDRVRPVCADVRALLFGDRRPEGTADVDVVMSFMFLHDLLADPDSRAEVIPRLRTAFPNAHTFLLADTVLRPRSGEDALPIFSSGFELAHALMGIPLHTRQAYEDLFVQGGLSVRRTVPFGAPHTYLFVLEAR